MNDKTKQSMDSEEDSTSSCENGDLSHAALIPLHPAANRVKVEAKQLPIVLGRTNLASWWWKSCPCQHYCRLHCRPVAQNIRSLSKVMVQVDTAGRVHVVGKNPHLITITPEREGNILQVNDIISIGRRDREPWMRFQVVQIPINSHDLPSSTNQRAAISKAPAPLLESVKPFVDFAPGNAGAAMAVSRTKNKHRPATAPVFENQKVILNLPSNFQAKDNPTNPPEWITTNTRKRKSGRASNSSVTMSNKSQQKKHQVQQSRQQKEAATAATITRVQRSYVQATHNANLNEYMLSEPARKRRRETSANGLHSKRSSRRAYRQGSFDNACGGTSATTNGENSKRDHPHVHLVFQDYQTSAILLQDNELQRKSESSINQGITTGRSANAMNIHHQHGGLATPRVFLADRSQLKLLSRNFAAALLGATSLNTDANIPLTQSQSLPDDATQQQDLKPEVEDEKGLTDRRDRLFLPSSEECRSFSPKNESVDVKSLAKIAETNEVGLHCVKTMEVDKDCILSLPQCASSSFEAGQKDFVSEPFTMLDHEQNRATRQMIAAPLIAKDDTGNERSSLLPSCDPIKDLKPWQDMIEQEEKEGKPSSFRHALASLIVAKNQDHLGEDGKRGLLWLPPLLGGDFEIEQQSET